MAQIREVLRNIESLIGLDLRHYFVPNILYVGAAEIVDAIAFLCLTVVLTRVLPQDTFGQFKYVLAVIGFVQVISLPE